MNIPIYTATVFHLIMNMPHMNKLYPIFATFFIFQKATKNKGLAFTFPPLLATFSNFHKGKQKSKAIAFTFRPLLATFSILHK
jgi:hypothetical protein